MTHALWIFFINNQDRTLVVKTNKWNTLDSENCVCIFAKYSEIIIADLTIQFTITKTKLHGKWVTKRLHGTLTQAGISLSGAIKLAHSFHAISLNKLLPNRSLEGISDHQTDFVLCFWHSVRLGQQIATDFADVQKPLKDIGKFMMSNIKHKIISLQ